MPLLVYDLFSQAQVTVSMTGHSIGTLVSMGGSHDRRVMVVIRQTNALTTVVAESMRKLTTDSNTAVHPVQKFGHDFGQ